MKKIIVLLMMVGSLFISGNSLFADAFDDCFEIERLKAKSDGLGAVESAEQASKVCKAKLGETQSQGNTTQNNNLADDSKSSGGFASIGVLSGVAIKGGYKFKNARIHYTNHAAPLNDDDFKTVTAGILGFDYIANGGFMIGIGTGNATSPDAQAADFTNCNISSSFNKNYSSSTSATSFNIGWLQNKKGFQYGLYLFAVTFADPLLSKDSFCNDNGFSVKTLQGFGGLKAEFGFVF